MNKNVIIGDADALIALLFEEDANYQRAVKISEYLYENEKIVIFPNTAIAEAITTFQRKFSSQNLARVLTQQYKKGVFIVEYIDEDIMQKAVGFYNPDGSKQNTFFDAIVVATAKKFSPDAIFSFDSWYKKLGFKLAIDLL